MGPLLSYLACPALTSCPCHYSLYPTVLHCPVRMHSKESLRVRCPVRRSVSVQKEGLAFSGGSDVFS